EVAGEAQPGPKQIRVPGQGREDVVVAEAAVHAPGDGLEDLLDVPLPLIGRKRRNTRAVAHRGDPTVTPHPPVKAAQCACRSKESWMGQSVRTPAEGETG